MTPEQVTVFFGNVDIMVGCLRGIFTMLVITTLILMQELIGGYFKKWMR